MPRLLLISLLLVLAGCSGTPSTRPADTPAKPATARDGPASRKAPPGDTRPADTGPARGAERLQALIADLRGADEGRRVRAAKELRQWGKDAEPAARDLSWLAVNSPPGEARQAALEALEAVYPEAAPDVRALVADDDPRRRIAAAKHLAGLPAKPSTPHPAARLAPVIAWRTAALPAEAQKADVGFALAGEEYAALVPLLFKAGPPDDQGFKAVVACAGSSPDGGRPLWEPAQITLCEIAKQDKDRRKEALDALDSSLSSRISVASIRAVGAIGPEAKPLARLLRALTLDRDAEVRKAAAEALKKVEG